MNGQPNAYADLVRRYQMRVLQLCVSMLSNHAQAEDAAQEIFFKAYESLKRFRQDSSFSTWLYRIASNHCLDLLRKKSRHKTESWDGLIEEKGEKIQELLVAPQDPDRAREDAELVRYVLSCLNPDYRLVLTLREIHGLNYQEIAQAMNCSLDSVKARLRRARRDFEEKLRHSLKSENV